MRNFSPNHYERAFENWLTGNSFQYIAVDEHKRAAFGRLKIKSFDFLLYPSNQQKGLRREASQGLTDPSGQTPLFASGQGQIIIAEVKGRKFKGTSFAKLTGFECWVTTDDVNGLTMWQEIFGPGHIAAFVFAYRIENIDVDFDGRDVFDYDANRYVFFTVKLDDYREFVKVRSPKWQTVTLPADKFRQCAVQINDLLL